MIRISDGDGKRKLLVGQPYIEPYIFSNSWVQSDEDIDNTYVRNYSMQTTAAYALCSNAVYRHIKY